MTRLALSLFMLALVQDVYADNRTNPMHKFHSRPDLIAPIITTELHHPELLSPGYIFLGPYQAEQEGPYIYDNGGNLIWSGFGAAGPGSVHAPHVCEYKGKPHMCYFQGTQMLGYGWGHGIIMDNNYRVVRSVEAATHQAASDEHEFRLTSDGKSALLSIYERLQYDLTEFGIKNGLGFIQQGVFQEVDVETGKSIFEWRSLDHVPPSESFVLPGTTEISGDGYSRSSPWDYFHINSIDKNAEGDYLISARHVSGVYKISGKDGSIIWRLGGIRSSFNQDFHFSSQHDARFVSQNKTHEVISIFDNASNGFNYTKDFSEGMIIVIDHTTKNATCTQNFNAPDQNGGLMSKSQGNTQLLSNGNAMLGWGNNAFFTEFTSNGTAVWHAWFALTGAMVYRVQKFNWTGIPLTVPALYTYSQNSSDMIFYMSWNGATEVRKWNLYTSSGSSSDGAYKLVKTIPKDGFETAYRHPSFAKWSYIEAVDAGGQVLSKSRPQQTYVPTGAIMEFCTDFACNEAVSPSEEELQKEKEEEERRQKAEEEKKAKEEEERKAKEKMEKMKQLRKRRSLALSISGISIMILALAFYGCGRNLRMAFWGILRRLARAPIDFKDWMSMRYQAWKGNYTKVNDKMSM